LRALAAAGAAAALAFAAAGCSGRASSATSTGPLEKPDIVIGAMPAIGSAAIYIAQDEGLFKQAGLNVKVVSLGAPQTVVPELERGAIDVLEYEWTTLIESMAGGSAKLHAIASAQALGPGSHEIVVPPHSGITSPAQLRGKTIGVQSLNGLDTLLVDSALALYGITPAQVRLVPVPFQEMQQALAGHQVAAVEPAEPFVTTLENGPGATTLFDMDQGSMLGFPVAGYTVTDQFATKYPKTTAALARVLGEAQAIASTNRAAVERAIAQAAHVSPAVAALAALGTFPANVDPVELQRLADLMLSDHEISQKFPATRLTRPIG
jgi:NitT/TauT family transport system substrate-binding protein